MWWFLRKRLSGGVFFTSTKTVTVDVPIETLTVRDTLRVPLAVPGCSADAVGAPEMETVVETGDHVDVGGLIARSASGVPNWARVFAPASGVIGDRTFVESVCGFAVPALELEPDADQAEKGGTITGSVNHRSEGLIDRLAALGIDAGAGGSTAASPSPKDGLERIIIDGLESGPYATARTRTLIENAPELIAVAERVAGALRVNAVHLVVDRTLGKLVSELRRQVRDTPVGVLAIPNKYPQCHPRMLFRAVTGRELSPNCTPRDAGAWIVGPPALWDIHRALTYGVPPVVQTLTVAGDAVQRPGNYRVLVGTSVASILRRVGLHQAVGRIVLGDALTGVAVRSADAVIARGVEGLYAWSPSATPVRDPLGCLRCGFCLDVCPVRIDPVSVFNAVELNRSAQVPSWAPRACIDCGLCDYVCPAALPLMEAMRFARRYAEGGPDA